MGNYLSTLCSKCLKKGQNKKIDALEVENQKEKNSINNRNPYNAAGIIITSESDDKSSTNSKVKANEIAIYNQGTLIEDEKIEESEKNNSKEQIYEQKLKKIYDEKQKLLDIEKKQLMQNKEDFEKMKNEFEIEKKDLEKRIQEINIKEQEFIKKDEENIINLKIKEDLINKQSKEIVEKKETLIKKENLLKEKETQLEQKEFELNNFKDKFNQEILIRQNQLQQKEDDLKKYDSSLKEFKLSLAQEKKNFEEDKKKYELSKMPHEIGLRNIGATCYMNATLQALSNTDKFTEYFLTKYNFNPNDSTKRMSNEMCKVLSNLWSENKKKGDYAPNDFKNTLSEQNPLFAGIQANDSKDLINFLLERFHQEMNCHSQNNNQNNIDDINQFDERQALNSFVKEYFGANKSIITDCFYGIMETKSKCCGCNYIKYNFQIFSFLEFPLKEVNNYMFQTGRRLALVNQDGTNPDINLYECFDYYQKLDLMNGQNQMYCNICNNNRDTYYGSTVYSLPNYLIINLNRGKGATYQCNVIFPEVLNLLNYVSFKNGNNVLQLYAVICHYGPSSMSGHFIAYCKHRKNNKWYKYNDSIVTECTQPNEYYNGMPYILFYKTI